MFLLLLVKEGGNWHWLWATTSSLLFLLSRSLPPPTTPWTPHFTISILRFLWLPDLNLISSSPSHHAGIFYLPQPFLTSLYKHSYVHMCVCVCGGQIEAARGLRLHNYALINNPYPYILHHIGSMVRTEGKTALHGADPLLLGVAEGSDTEANPGWLTQLLLNGSKISF